MKMGTIERGNTAQKIVDMLDGKYERITEKLCVLALAKAIIKQQANRKSSNRPMN